MPPISWRDPSPADLAVIARWAIDEGWPGRAKGVPLDEVEFTTIAHLPDHQSRCLAGEDSTPQAFGQVWTDAQGGVHLVRLIVDPARRGQGLGRLLCQRLLADALARSTDGRVRLKLRRDNAAALRVYLSVGFREEEPAPAPHLLVLVYQSAPEPVENKARAAPKE
jgi:ribosomal protein S18 acetylase RimI-like enzyme